MPRSLLLETASVVLDGVALPLKTQALGPILDGQIATADQSIFEQLQLVWQLYPFLDMYEVSDHSYAWPGYLRSRPLPCLLSLAS